MSERDNWLEYTDAEYDENHKKWELTWDVFTGEYASQEKSKEYLHKRAWFEKEDAWKLRSHSTDPDLTLFTLTASLVGQAHSTEEDDKIDFGDLGNPDQEGTTAAKIWRDADGEGTDYPVAWKKYASRQFVFQTMYVLEEGVQTKEMEDGGTVTTQEARTVFISPQMVLAKGDGWIKVKHSVVTNDDTWETNQDKEDQYTVYHLDGWERYRSGKEGPVLIDSGAYDFYTDKTQKQRRLPIFAVRLPFDMYFAYMIAKKVIVNYNMDSVIDTFVFEATTTTLVDEDEPILHESNKDDLLGGETHVSTGSKMYYIAPPEGPAAMGNERIQIKRKELLLTALQQLGDAARMATATEIRYKSKSGIEAFLNLFVTTLEEAQNESLFLKEQIYFPDKPAMWGKAYVQKSKKFQVLDPMELVRLVTDLVFGPNKIPVTDDMVLDAVEFIWENHLGFTLEEEQVQGLREVVEAYTRKRDGLRPALNGRANQLLESFNNV